MYAIDTDEFWGQCIPPGSGIVDDWNNNILDIIETHSLDQKHKLFAIFVFDPDSEQYFIDDIKRKWERLDNASGNGGGSYDWYLSYKIEYSSGKVDVLFTEKKIMHSDSQGYYGENDATESELKFAKKVEYVARKFSEAGLPNPGVGLGNLNDIQKIYVGKLFDKAAKLNKEKPELSFA